MQGEITTTVAANPKKVKKAAEKDQQGFIYVHYYTSANYRPEGKACINRKECSGAVLQFEIHMK